MLQFFFEAFEEDRLLIAGDFEEGEEAERCLGVLEAWSVVGVGVGVTGGVAEVEHGLETVVLDGLTLLPIVVHDLVEGRLVGDGTLCIVLVVFGQFGELPLAILVVVLQVFGLLVEPDLQ